MNESIGSEHSYLEYILDVEHRKDEVNGMEIYSKTAVLYVDRAMSWVDTHYRTPQELHYNQVLFNIAELHRRRLQVVIDTGGSVNMNYYTRLLTYEVDSFCHYTRYGADTAIVAWWEEETRRQMDSITPVMVEMHQKANTIESIRPELRMHFNMGGGAKIFAGDMTKYFAPSGGAYFDFEGGCWRHLFTFGAYIGGGKCLPDTIFTLNDDNMLYSTDNILTLDMYANYGFVAIDSRKFSLTPFVGYGMQGFFYQDYEGESSGGPTEGCWRAGVDFKYYFADEGGCFDNHLEQLFCALHGRLYLSHDRFKSIVGSPQGCTINLQLGISLGMRMAKIRRAVKASK